jgi:cyclin-dependent kinase 8/11
MPEYKTYLNLGPYNTTSPLPAWYHSRSSSAHGYDLLCRLFEWDPAKRITARECLGHPWFQEDGGVNSKCVDAVFMEIERLTVRSVFEGSTTTYPTRRVTHEDNGDAKMGS